MSVSIEGPEESFFNQQQDAAAAAPPAAGGATGEEQQQKQHEEQQQEHHPVLQELVACTHFDNAQCPWLTMTMSLHQKITQLPMKLLVTSSVVGQIVASVTADQQCIKIPNQR